MDESSRTAALRRGGPNTAMVLAAWRGTRRAAIPDLPPKPLVQVYGKALIEHAIDLLTAAGVQRVVVNTHHRADLIESFLTRHVSPVPAVSRECELLDTGGVVKKALPLLGDEPFFVTHADLIWEIGADRALHRTVEVWDPRKLEVLMLLYPDSKRVRG